MTDLTGSQTFTDLTRQLTHSLTHSLTHLLTDRHISLTSCLLNTDK